MLKETWSPDFKSIDEIVLILILMEHAQRDRIKYDTLTCLTKVLILILMEHAQRDNGILFKDDPTASLNPYFNGTCSKSPA